MPDLQKWGGYPPNGGDVQCAWLLNRQGEPRPAIWTPDESEHGGSWEVPGLQAKVFPIWMQNQRWSYLQYLPVPDILPAAAGAGPSCPNCRKPAQFYPTSHLFVRNNVDYGPVWACQPCDHWTWCRRGTKEPNGPLLSSAERRAKMKRGRAA